MPAITATFDMGLKIAPQARTMAAPSTCRSNVVENEAPASKKEIAFGLLLGLAVWSQAIGYFFS